MGQRRERSWLAWIRGPFLFGDAGERAHVALAVNQPLILAREPSNPKDSNAIVVSDLLGARVGYVAREVAALVAPVMDAGCMVLAKVAKGSTKRPVGWTHARALLWVDGVADDEVIEKARAPTVSSLSQRRVGSR